MKTFVAWLAKGFCFVIIHLPRPVQAFLGQVIGWLWFDVLRIRRKVVMDNLARAFPEWSKKRRCEVARQSLHHMGYDLIEYCYLPFLTKENYQEHVVFEGWEHMEAARAKGKGVCCLTLHLGHGDLAVSAMSLAGLPSYLISKEFKMQWLNDMWFKMRMRAGTQFIPPRNSSYAILKALKKKALVIFVQDQFMGPPIGVRTTFFGHETGTAMGLAIMADRSKAPVLPIYTYRREDGKHVICFEPEIEFTSSEDRDETVARMTQIFNDHLEGWVRKHPEQWMWVHRRWKKFG